VGRSEVGRRNEIIKEVGVEKECMKMGVVGVGGEIGR
jgi:hypothetical protein